MWFEGALHIALSSDAGTLYVSAENLKPVREEYRRYFRRWRDGRPLVAVYDDLLACKALVMPAGSGLADALRVKAAKMTAPVFHWPDPEEEAAEAEAAAEALVGQMDIDDLKGEEGDDPEESEAKDDD